MPLLMKEIIPEGSFLVSSNKGRVRRTFNRQTLQELADQNNKMLAAGIRIPTPFDHVKEAEPIEIDKPSPSSFHNGGYWQQFFVTTNDEGKPVIKGIVDLPGSETDKDSAYYKALHTNKEVSANIRETFTDGLGRVWNSVFGHVALVNHAVVPGQKEFEKIDGIVVNMSMMEPSDSNVGDLATKLREVLLRALKVSVPEFENPQQFIRDLFVAVSQIDSSRPQDGQVLEPVPIYMSTGAEMQLSLEQAQALVATGTVNPGTKKPWTLEDFGHKTQPTQVQMSANAEIATMQAQLAEKDSKITQLQAIAKAFMTKLTNDTKASILKRIEALKAAGIVNEQIFETMLKPKLEFNMSIDSANGQLADHPLEMMLSVLEAQLPQKQAAPDPFAALFGNTIPTGAEIVNPPGQGNTEMTAESMNNAIEELVGLV